MKLLMQADMEKFFSHVVGYTSKTTQMRAAMYDIAEKLRLKNK